MSLELLWKQGKTKTVGSVVLDAVLQEGYDLSADVTKRPVENGTVLSDHITINPLSISLTGFIGEMSLTTLVPIPGRVVNAYAELEELHNKRAPVILVTGLNKFQQMVITSFKYNREATNAGMEFQMTLTQIRVVSSQLANIPGSQLASGSKKQVESAVTKGVTAGTPTTASVLSQERAAGRALAGVAP